MKINVKDLTDEALDWAVAIAANYTQEPFLDDMAWVVASGKFKDAFVSKDKRWSPSTDWTQGGPILDAERIATERAGDGWAALHDDTFCSKTYVKALHGPTLLVAGMRCFVAHKLGHEIDVPAHLISNNPSVPKEGSRYQIFAEDNVRTSVKARKP